MSMTGKVMLILGALAQVHCSPRPSGFDGGYGEKSSSSSSSSGGSLSRFDQEYSNSFGSNRRDFDEGHKEDIEQESIKYHSLVNKALNTAKDADRFVGDSIKEQERSAKDYPRIKRSALPLAPSEKRNFRPLSPEMAPAAPVAEAVAAPARRESPATALEPVRGSPAARPVKEIEINDREAPKGLAARGGDDYEDEAPAGGEEAAGAGQKSAKGGEVSPDKIDEMIDLMNSLNQKFAKMIANWDDTAGGESTAKAGAGSEAPAGAEEPEAGGDEGGETPARRRGAKAGKKNAEAGGDYDDPEEDEAGGAEEGGPAGAAGAKRAKLANIL